MPNQKLTGTVIHGQGRGKKLGFPTANLKLDNPDLRPEPGVYAGWALLSHSPQSDQKDAGGTAPIKQGSAGSASAPIVRGTGLFNVSRVSDEQRRSNKALQAGPAGAAPLAETDSAAFRVYPAAVHCGPVPTFDEATPTIEAHLLDFPGGDLYGRTLTLDIVAKIRDVEKFNSTAALIRAIQQDCDQTRALLNQNNSTM